MMSEDTAAPQPVSEKPSRGRRDQIARTIAWLSAGAAITLAVVLTGFYQTIGDRHWRTDMLVVYPPLAWMVVIAGLFTPVLIAKSWRLIALGFITLVAFFLINGEWISLFRPAMTPESPRHGLRVICWNIYGISDWPRALSNLEPWHPDVIFFSESPDGPASEAIHGALQGAWQGFHWHDQGDTAILSRYPIEPLPTEKIGPWDKPALARVTFTGGPDDPSNATALLCGVRFMMPASATIPTAWLGNLGAWPRIHKDRLAQYDQMRKLIAGARRDKEPVIMAGDINTQGISKSLRSFRKSGFHDAWPEAGTGWGDTFMAELPIARIDQVWVSNDLRGVQARVARGSFSDHRYVVTDIVPKAAN